MAATRVRLAWASTSVAPPPRASIRPQASKKRPLRARKAISRRVAEVTGVPIQPNTPIVGANAFAHASGIHQDGIIKDPENYEFVPPTLVGAPGHKFVFTARSGRRAIAHRAAAMGRPLDARTVDAVYRDFLQVAEQRRGEVPDEEIAAMIQRAACV